MHIRLLAFAAAATLLSGTAASASGWQMACGDDLYCVARIDLTDAKGGAARMKIERSNKDGASVFVTFGPADPLAVGMPVIIEMLGTGFAHEGPVDKVYGGNEMTFAEAARGPIVEALRGAVAAQVTVRFGGSIGTRIHDVPLDGLTQALLAIDTAQGRIGHTDAMVAWGSAREPRVAAAAAQSPAEPASEPAPAAPEQSATSTGDAAPIGSGEIIYAAADLPPAIAAFAPRFGCALDETLPAWGANAIGMGGGSVMVAVPCLNGDINIESYVARTGPGADPAKLYQFEQQPGLEPAWRDTIINPNFDATTGLLSATTYDSPDGDCGHHEVHRLLPDDSFELIEVRVKADCDGATTAPAEWPVEWTIAEMGG